MNKTSFMSSLLLLLLLFLIGYSGNGFVCHDVDECLVNNGGCSQAPRVDCINTVGSRECGPCPRGMLFCSSCYEKS